MGKSAKTRPWTTILSGALGGTVIVLVSTIPAAASTATSDAHALRTHTLCEQAVTRWERISTVPNKLLHAISLAESGKWSKRDRRVRAWPWTVTSGGPGSYFNTKREALAEVRRLQSRGVTNIDVGCMQVNLHFHGHNFGSIEEAMDPDLNAAYAAKFLTNLRRNADNWAEAAGHYHSMTPGRTERYRGKVEKFWANLRGGSVPTRDIASLPATEATSTTSAPQTYRIVPIDRARTAALNARFKTLRTAARSLRDELDPEVRRKKHLQAWRNASTRGASLQHLLAMRKAELAKREQEKIKTAIGSNRAERFADNRRRQLAQWRARQATGVPASTN